ncbi:MAG: M81 family metallopeptidase [Bradyrhizobium sp.]|uniref:M81 family metallopeptidase n=1 Tax=Bradyrhizobium sp. TaxID=376 RepID=UPI003C7EA928
MRVFTGTLATETNTFAPMPTGLSAFKERGYYPAGTHPEHMSMFAGPLFVARQRAAQYGWTVIEGMVAAANPGGLVTRAAYETLRDELLADLQAAMPVDIVLLGLHGAMVADGYDDCEGDLLARVREIVGPRAVVGAELDPHAHVSALMVQSADVLIAFKEYPHIDVRERAEELVTLCRAKATGEICFAPALIDCEMVVPIHTTRDPGRALVQRMQSLEGRDGILSVSMIQGFATGDVPDMGSKVLVYADGDQAKAQRLARELADEVIGLRDQLMVRYLDVDTALDRALAADGGPIVLADRSDNPGSGASGDSTFILRRLLERGITDAALGPLWDPIAVRIAFDAGVGARIALRIGGKTGPLSGDPVDAECTIRALIPDMMQASQAGGTPSPMGDCALVSTGGVDIVLNAVRTQALDYGLFAQLGCDPTAKKIIVVKSAQHFHASFAKVAREIIYVGAPGSADPNYANLPYKKIRQPKWPIS